MVEQALGRPVRPCRATLEPFTRDTSLTSAFVRGERERLLIRAFIIRAIVPMTMMPDAGVRKTVTAFAGDLAMMPWAMIAELSGRCVHVTADSAWEDAEDLAA